jgi:hypothetical protein
LYQDQPQVNQQEEIEPWTESQGVKNAMQKAGYSQCKDNRAERLVLPLVPVPGITL